MAEDNNNYRKKLYSIVLSLVAIVVLFGAVVVLNSVATQMGFPLFNFSYGDTPAQNIQADQGRAPPAGVTGLPDSSQDGDWKIVSLLKAVDITISDQSMTGWASANKDWRLIHASSDSVNSNGLSYGWNLVLKGNDSILTATVQNGKLIGANTEDTVAMPVLKTRLDKIWDSTWVMYSLTNNTSVSVKGNYYAIEYLDDGRSGVYTIFGNDLPLLNGSTSVQIDATTGNRLGGDGE